MPQLQPAGLANPLGATVVLNIRLRDKPTVNGSTVLRTLTPGEYVITWHAPIIAADGYQWVWVEAQRDGLRGYCAAVVDGVASFDPPVIEPLPAPPSLIIDVSSNNGAIDWKRARAAGVREAYIRATMGGAGVDTQWHFNTSGAIAAGVKVGHYHLFRPDSDGLPQARFILGKQKIIDLPLAVDVERVVAPKRNLTKDQYAEQLAAFVQHIQAETGDLPTIYTSAGEWGALVGRRHDALFAQCDLWVANYTTKPKPFLPRCWTTYWLWQFTSSGKVDGLPGRCDLNRRHL